MRKLLIALAGATVFAGAAQAMPNPAPNLRAAIDELSVAELQDVQYRYRGRRHCWYARGWNGPGWYWCGYSSRRNHGWGGPDGWNDWRRR